ncbi:MAG TPA: hypothetical protein VJV79_34635 [Polyangiaceae bacterium]|nr:hypothetical protein [Polyangiaceae bacterium]
MPLTRGLGLVQRSLLGTRLLARACGLCGLLVTSCQNGPSPAILAAAGEPSLFGGTEAGAGSGGGGQLLTSVAGRGPLSAGGAGAPGARPGGQSAGQSGVEHDFSAAGAGTNAEGGSNAVEVRHYPGQGFIVHEWGTDTIVVGSDGSLQRGLHHEEEDLPSFVYDRIKAGTLIGSSPSTSVTIKMETPVTYFYSPTPLLVNARVDFPKGVLTQWYPGVTAFLPPLAAAGSITLGVPAELSDPALDPSFPFVGETCRLKFGSVSGGRLDWTKLTVHARGTTPEKPLPSAPISDFGWSYARDVDANLLQMPGGESERFLFYRGLGEFDLPVKVEAQDGGKIKLTNGYTEAVGHVFLLNVDRDHGAFAEHAAGIAEGGSLQDTVPSLQGAPSVDEYAARLSDAVTRALDATGLYHDEAIAMVNTWRRQWFRTPGVRVLYLLPQSWTEQSIPLTLSPKPDATVRVMLIRAELITREQELADVSSLSAFETDAPAATAYFSALGRFAEPRLRRALQLSVSAAGEKYLSQVAHAKSSVVSGE